MVKKDRPIQHTTLPHFTLQLTHRLYLFKTCSPATSSADMCSAIFLTSALERNEAAGANAWVIPMAISEDRAKARKFIVQCYGCTFVTRRLSSELTLTAKI